MKKTETNLSHFLHLSPQKQLLTNYKTFLVMNKNHAIKRKKIARLVHIMKKVIYVKKTLRQSITVEVLYNLVGISTTQCTANLNMEIQKYQQIILFQLHKVKLIAGMQHYGFGMMFQDMEDGASHQIFGHNLMIVLRLALMDQKAATYHFVLLIILFLEIIIQCIQLCRKVTDQLKL